MYESTKDMINATIGRYKRKADLEVTHDGHDGLASAQEHLTAGHLLHHRHLLIHNPEEVHRARCPQLPVISLFRLPCQIRLQPSNTPSPLNLIMQLIIVSLVGNCVPTNASVIIIGCSFVWPSQKRPFCPDKSKEYMKKQDCLGRSICSQEKQMLFSLQTLPCADARYSNAIHLVRIRCPRHAGPMCMHIEAPA